MLEVLQARCRCDVRAPGSTVVWVPKDVGNQASWILLLMTVEHFFSKDVCFRDPHLSNVLMFGLRDTQRSKLSKPYPTSPTSEIK